MEGRDVKIRAGVNVVHKMHKAQGGLIKAAFQVNEGRFTNVRLSGDFLNVSKQAMIIRLQNLGLLINHTGREMTWHRYECPA